MFRNPLFSLALLLTSTLCASAAIAQSPSKFENWRGDYSSPALVSGNYRGSQPGDGDHQGSNDRLLSSGTYTQGQSCANGSCSAGNAAVPVVSSAAPIINHSTYSIAQYPVVLGSSMKSSTQPNYNAYIPAQSSTLYSPHTAHYHSTQAISTTISSCTGSVTSRRY